MATLKAKATDAAHSKGGRAEQHTEKSDTLHTTAPRNDSQPSADDVEIARQIKLMRKVMHENRHVLKKLADS